MDLTPRNREPEIEPEIETLAPYKKKWERLDPATLADWRDVWFELTGRHWTWRHPHGVNRKARRRLAARARQARPKQGR